MHSRLYLLSLPLNTPLRPLKLLVKPCLFGNFRLGSVHPLCVVLRLIVVSHNDEVFSRFPLMYRTQCPFTLIYHVSLLLLRFMVVS